MSEPKGNQVEIINQTFQNMIGLAEQDIHDFIELKFKRLKQNINIKSEEKTDAVPN